MPSIFSDQMRDQILNRFSDIQIPRISESVINRFGQNPREQGMQQLPNPIPIRNEYTRSGSFDMVPYEPSRQTGTVNTSPMQNFMQQGSTDSQYTDRRVKQPLQDFSDFSRFDGIPGSGRMSSGTTVIDSYDPETDTYYGSVGGFAGSIPVSYSGSEVGEQFKKNWEIANQSNDDLIKQQRESLRRRTKSVPSSNSGASGTTAAPARISPEQLTAGIPSLNRPMGMNNGGGISSLVEQYRDTVDAPLYANQGTTGGVGSNFMKWLTGGASGQGEPPSLTDVMGLLKALSGLFGGGVETPVKAPRYRAPKTTELEGMGTIGMNDGGTVLNRKLFLGGGEVDGIGGERDDLVPIWASDREYVVSANGVRRMGGGNHARGIAALDEINNDGRLI